LLSELLEEYKELTDEKQKQELIKTFQNKLWNSKYTHKTSKKYYKFKINETLLNNRSDLIEIFNKHKIIEYTVCKSFYKKILSPIDYIRIHINNMFGYLVDKNIYLPKEYYQLLLTPKNEYFHVIEMLKSGEQVDCNELKYRINFALTEAEEIKSQVMQNKIELRWSEYKKLINIYIERLFNNYIPPHEYENEHGWEFITNIDSWNENNYIVKYFCKSLTGYLRNYIRDSKPKEVKKKSCVVCGTEINSKSNRKKYCDECFKVIRRNQNRQNFKKWYDKNNS
jgi:predicted nucleic acid-binding Zn ribbon protein